MKEIRFVDTENSHDIFDQKYLRIYESDNYPTKGDFVILNGVKYEVMRRELEYCNIQKNDTTLLLKTVVCHIRKHNAL